MDAEKDDFARRWKPALAAAWRTGLDLLFPPQSLDNGPRPLAGGFTADAWSRIRFLDGPVCDGCGVPYEFDPGVRCAACLAEPRAFDAARSLVLPQTPAAAAVVPRFAPLARYERYLTHRIGAAEVLRLRLVLSAETPAR